MAVNIYFLSAAAGVIALLWEATKTLRNGRKTSLEDVIHHALEPILHSLAEVKTEIAVIVARQEPMWAAYNAGIRTHAQVLHHPEPSRTRVDHLLEVMQDNTITTDELEELRGHLETIMRWEPGQDAPYKIFQGEQPSAAALLASLDAVTSVDAEYPSEE